MEKWSNRSTNQNNNKITLITKICASITRLNVRQTLIVFQAKWSFMTFGNSMSSSIVNIECCKDFHAVIMSAEWEKKREKKMPNKIMWLSLYKSIWNCLLTDDTSAIPIDFLEWLAENQRCQHSMCEQWILTIVSSPYANRLYHAEFRKLLMPGNSLPLHTVEIASVYLPNVHFAPIPQSRRQDRPFSRYI